MAPEQPFDHGECAGNAAEEVSGHVDSVTSDDSDGDFFGGDAGGDASGSFSDDDDS